MNLTLLCFKRVWEFIGNIGVHNIKFEHNRCEIGYWITGLYEGQSLMSEAVAKLEQEAFERGFNRIEIRCSSANNRSARLPQRLGYSLEGTLRQDSIEMGQYRDTLVFAKLKSKSIGNVKAGLLHHVEIYVSDLEKTKKFWVWFLSQFKYQVVSEWGQGFSIKYKDTYLVFVQTESKYLKNTYHRCSTGLNHLAFHADSREQVDDLTLQLKEKNINILYEDKHPYAGGEHYYAVFFEDPDRIKVEVVASC